MTREEAIDWLCRLKSEIKIFMPYQWQKPFEEALDMAIKALEREPKSFQWCHDCKEYDQDKHCCHRWSKVIRNTVEEMKQEQEPKKGYLSIDDVMSVFDDFMCGEVDENGTELFLEMLKDKAESEG